MPGLVFRRTEAVEKDGISRKFCEKDCIFTSVRVSHISTNVYNVTTHELTAAPIAPAILSRSAMT